MKQQHLMTWRMHYSFYVWATSREEAIQKAIDGKPAHIPAGTELYYGVVGGVPVYVAEDEDPKILIESA